MTQQPSQSETVRPRRWYAAPLVCRSVAIAAALVALIRVALGIQAFSSIVDEPVHLASAIGVWDVGKLTIITEHPPVARLAAGLPLFLAGARLPEDLRSKTVLSEPESYEHCGRIVWENNLSFQTMLTRARLAVLLFAAVTLLYLYLLTRWAGGETAAMLAVVFFSFDPTFLGHAGWVTTDSAACAGFLAGTYHGLQWIYRRTWPSAVAAGVAGGLAVGAKFTCLLLVPALLGVLVARSIAWREFRIRPLGRSVAQLAGIAIVAFVALWATYLFDVGPMRDQTAFGRQREWQQIPAWLKNAPIPMPSFPLGIMRLLGHNRWGHAAYLNGEISRYGWWYYFPEAIVIKSPLAMLLGLAVAIGAAIWLRGRGLGRTASALSIGGMFFVSAMLGNLSIGIRHILPVIPLLYLFISVVLVQARLSGLLGALALVGCIETGRVHPDYLAFFNMAAGGPDRGQRFLLDSNLDWGQDVKRLADWLKSPEAAGRNYTLRIFTYPHDRIAREYGLDPSAFDRPPGGLLAISKSIRHGLLGAQMLPGGEITHTEDYSWLARFPVVKRIGYSIEVYDLSGSQPEKQ